MSVNDAERLLEQVRVPEFAGYVNNFARQHGTVLQQHEFDALVSLTFQFGPRVWTEILDTGQPWNVATMVRQGPPFDREVATLALYGGFMRDDDTIPFHDRRTRERDVFLNGH